MKRKNHVFTSDNRHRIRQGVPIRSDFRVIPEIFVMPTDPALSDAEKEILKDWA